MGLLTDLLAEVSGSNTIVDNDLLLDAACISLISDGGASEEEIRWTLPVLSALPAYAALSASAFAEKFRASIARCEALGTLEAAMKNLVARLATRDEKEQAFVVAVTVQHADDALLEDEDTFVIQLGAALEISEDRANELLIITEQCVAQHRITHNPV